MSEKKKLTQKGQLEGDVKKLSLKEQLEKDIVGYTQQIVNLAAQMNQYVGARNQAEGMLKQMKESKVKEK